MAANDPNPEKLNRPPSAEGAAPKREVDDFLDRADKAREKQKERNKPLGEQILGILKKLSQPEVPPAEPIMDALVGGAEIASVDREILNNIADPQPEAPRDADTFIPKMEQAAAQGAQLREEDKRRKDAQDIQDIKDKRDMAEDLQMEGYPILSKIVNPDIDHSPAPVPERGTTQFVQDLEATAQQGSAEGAAIKAQREADEAAAAALAEAQRQAENAEMRRRIDSAGFKIPGLAENATPDEKRAARAAYVAQMMEDTKAGIDQVTWQREQDQTILDGTPQGQVKRDPSTGEIINPYKRPEAGPVYTPRVDAVAAELAQREQWELTDRERRSIDRGLALPLIDSRTEQSALFGFDVADPMEWPGGERQMRAFQAAMADAINHFDQAIATPANGRDETKKLNLPFTANAKTPGGGFAGDKYYNGKHGIPMIEAVRQGVDAALVSAGPSEYANDELRALMVKALETRVRIKKLQADITKTKAEIASQKKIADKEPVDKKNGFRPVVEKNQRILAALRAKLQEEQGNTASLITEIAKTRTKVETHRRNQHIEVRTGVPSIDIETGNIIHKAAAPSTEVRTTTVDVPQAPVAEAAPAARPATPAEASPAATPEAHPAVAEAPAAPEPTPPPETKDNVEKEPTPDGEFVSAGESHRGGRPEGPDEDAIFSGSGLHLGEIGGDKNKIVTDEAEKARSLAMILNEIGVPDVTAESVQELWTKVDQLKKEGKIGGLDIVLDGMGGHGAGEVASSIGMFAIVQEVANAAAAEGVLMTGETVRSAMIKASELIKKYNEKNISDSGATAIVALTTPDGRTILGSAGDARAYRIEEDGTTTQLTRDHSTVFRSMATGILRPSDIFRAPFKSEIYRALDGNIKAGDIEIYENVNYNLLPGEKMVLVCDGVWESAFSPERGGLTATTEDILGEIDALYEQRNAALDKKFPNPDQAADKINAREQLHMQAQGEIFNRIILAGHEKDNPAAMAKYLTRETAGMVAGDNISAVVVERHAPPPPAAEAARTPTEDPDWLTNTARVTRVGASTSSSEARPATSEPIADVLWTDANQAEAERRAAAAVAQPTTAATEPAATTPAEAEVNTKTPEEEADEREAAMTQEVVETKYIAKGAVAFSTMLDGLHSLGQENSNYLRGIKTQIEPKEKNNEGFKKAVAKVLEMRTRNSISSERRAQIMDYAKNALNNIAAEPDMDKRKQLAAEAKATAADILKAWKGTANKLAHERAQVTDATSDTELEGDGIRLPGEPATLTDQAEILNKQTAAAEAAIETKLNEQLVEFNSTVDALVNIDETVAAEKKAAREDTRTAAEIAAETALAAAELDILLGKDNTVSDDEKAEVKKNLLDFLKNSKMKAPIFIAAVVIMGVAGLLRSGAAAKRGRF